MKMRYSMLLLLSGAAWFLIAGVFGYAIPVMGGMWFRYLVCAVLTSFIVGISFRVPILRWSGWRWYVLPLLTLLAGTTLFGFLLPCAWALTDSLDNEAFWKLPLAVVFYSMTFYLVPLYPLALLTQHLLRRGMRGGGAELAASPNGRPAEPPDKSGLVGGRHR
ncbi:membrane hypothetical protein [Verrucomicrobia bacterium]|nr:membrane hypothetical protein [Verrucomicrobiota bacterium]